MAETLWSEYARATSEVELSPSAGEQDSVATSVVDQCATARAVTLDWRAVPTVVAQSLDDTPGSWRPPLLGPALDVTPERERLVPLETVAAAPADHGFVEVYPEAVTAQDEDPGSGPLSGLTYARKDMVFRAGHLCECGSPVREGFVPTTTAPVLQRLDAAGAREVGRLHMAELALSPTGRNNWLGPGRNPWDRDHASGGSSSGSGIAAAARAVDFTLGSDTGGSVRAPAAACGVTGLKPTQGVLPLDGTMPLAPTLDCLGILAPSARTVAAVFEVLVADEAGRDGGAEGPVAERPTIMVPELGEDDPLDAQTLTAFRAMAEAFARAGYPTRPCPVPDLDTPARISSLITATEAASVWGDELSTDPERFYLEIRRRIERGTLVPASVYARALRLQPTLTRGFADAYLPAGALLLLPTIPGVAPTVESTITGEPSVLEQRFGEFSYWTRAINYFGLPGISVPAGFGDHGLPLGVQLIGRPYTDRDLLRAAIAVQEVTDWHRRRPDQPEVTS